MCPDCREDSRLHLLPCEAYIVRSRVTHNDDSVWCIFEHHQEHNHDRHPVPGLSLPEKFAVAVQVVANPSASALQHRAGTAGPNSNPLHTINRSLADPDRARKAVRTAQANNGIAQSTGGAFDTFEQLDGLAQELGEPFILKSSLANPSYILLQTQSMRGALADAVKSWINAAAVSVELQQLDPESDRGREGAVTDSDHSYLRSWKLLVCCIWDPTLEEYVPVLWGIIRRLDAEHHIDFFHTLMTQIADAAGQNFGPHLFQQVRGLPIVHLSWRANWCW